MASFGRRLHRSGTLIRQAWDRVLVVPVILAAFWAALAWIGLDLRILEPEAPNWVWWVALAGLACLLGAWEAVRHLMDAEEKLAATDEQRHIRWLQAHSFDFGEGVGLVPFDDVLFDGRRLFVEGSPTAPELFFEVVRARTGRLSPAREELVDALKGGLLDLASFGVLAFHTLTERFELIVPHGERLLAAIAQARLDIKKPK